MNGLKFDEAGLLPAIVQDANTKEVLTLAYMNEESLAKTLETRETWFYSRSRQELWHKGETSGNTQKVQEILYAPSNPKMHKRTIQTERKSSR